MSLPMQNIRKMVIFSVRKTDRTVGLDYLENNSSIQPYDRFFCLSVACIPNFSDQIGTRIRFLCFVRWPFLKFKVIFSVRKSI